MSAPRTRQVQQLSHTTADIQHPENKLLACFMGQGCYHDADSQLPQAKCLSVQVVVATSKRQKNVDGTMKPGLLWDVPLMLGNQKEGSDRNRIQCIVFDFVVHPDTCRMALNNAKFKVSHSIKFLNLTMPECMSSHLDRAALVSHVSLRHTYTQKLGGAVFHTLVPHRQCHCTSALVFSFSFVYRTGWKQ